MSFFATVLITLILCSIGVPVLAAICRLLGFYTIVEERQAKVYVLFGKVLDTISEPGLHLLWQRLGPVNALLVNFVGQCRVVDLRLDQQYLRSQPVNSEEGAPMGIGVWYEMFIVDPQAYLFKNADPKGSLQANVSNATVRCLSNLKLNVMLENRHEMSRTVRQEVTGHTLEWGYRLGSVYVRKVHFRDRGMIKQIEEKVVNRLRQVTAAIKQDGDNQVSLITRTAERQAAIANAQAAAIRPKLVGEAIREISTDEAVSKALFEILETQKMLDSNADIVVLPAGRSEMLADLMATPRPRPAPPVAPVVPTALRSE